jgi:RNA polymerase-binding transcription factor DksA
MDLKAARLRLEAERERLVAIRDGIRDDLGNEGPQNDRTEALSELSLRDQHPADIGTEVFEQEKTHSILASVEGELIDVDRALERVADGTYGTCEACRKPIPQARLQALPAARFCLKDQARAERESRAS